MENELDTPADPLFANILGPEYWVANSGVSRRSWEILLLRKAMLDDHPWSLAECATRYGISRERVRQLEQEAVAKLLAWKQADDERRAAERRKDRLSLSNFVYCLTRKRPVIPANAAVPPESVSSDGKFMLAKANAAQPALRRPRWTFEQLRIRLLDTLSSNDLTRPVSGER